MRIFLPDGDDFVIKSSDEVVFDEPVVFLCVGVCVCEKGLEIVCIRNYPPFQYGCFFLFVTRTTAYALSQKQTLGCMLSRCKVSPQSVHKQTHDASLNVATLLVDKLP